MFWCQVSKCMGGFQPFHSPPPTPPLLMTVGHLVVCILSYTCRVQRRIIPEQQKLTIAMTHTMNNYQVALFHMASMD